MSPLDDLLQRAFFRGPAPEANRLIDRIRRQVVAAVGQAVNYEVSLLEAPGSEPRGWSYLDQVVAPRLAFFLRSKRLSTVHCSAAFIALFHQQTIYFIHAADFFEAVRLARGLDVESFARLARGWERTGEAVAGMLGPGPGDRT